MLPNVVFVVIATVVVVSFAVTVVSCYFRFYVEGSYCGC